VLVAASEVAPFSKTGGLGDVIAALPAALVELAALRVTVVSPWYPSVAAEANPVAMGSLNVPFDGGEVAVKLGELFIHGVRYVFIRHPDFDRAEPYGYPDDVRRFAFFSRAVTALLARLEPRVEVVHVHDWQAGLVPAILKAGDRVPDELRTVGSVMTLHNLQHQGRWNPSEALRWSGLPRTVFVPDGVEFFGDVNCLKAGIVFADRVNTVSPTHAAEILSKPLGEGLDGVLRHLSGKLTGILNGIDVRTWNPAADLYLDTRRYGEETFTRGKAENREALQRACGLAPDARTRVIGVVSRLVAQKGLDLLLEAVEDVLRFDVQLVILGTGEADLEDAFKRLAARKRTQVFAHIGFDERRAHQIYAGSDLFLMPSRFEPCGLGQMIAMRYGAVPVVRRTGGLADTVEEAAVDESGAVSGTGFLFDQAAPAALADAVGRAVATPLDTLRQIGLNGLRKDWSWSRSAREYLALYQQAAARA
jgi:starch synthase